MRLTIIGAAVALSLGLTGCISERETHEQCVHRVSVAVDQEMQGTLTPYISTTPKFAQLISDACDKDSSDTIIARLT